MCSRATPETLMPLVRPFRRSPGLPGRLLVLVLATLALALGGYAVGRTMDDPPEARHDASAGPAPPSGSERTTHHPVASAPDDRPPRHHARRAGAVLQPTEGTAAASATDGSSPAAPTAPTAPAAPAGTTDATDATPPATVGPTTAAPSPTSPSPTAGPSDSATSSALPKDVTPPETTVSGEFPDADAATFTLAADEPATFACSLDGAGYAPCGTVVRYVDLAAGWHTLAVRATDLAGNTDPTPAETTWHAAKGG